MQPPRPIRHPPSRPIADLPPAPRGSLVLVGASVRAAAESARRAGFSPIAVDHYGDRETLIAADRWYPLDEIRGEKPSRSPESIAALEAPVAIVGGLDGGYRWLDGRPLRFFGADPERFAQSESPAFLQKLADRASVAFPETRRSGSTEKGWLMKQRSGSGGLGVRYCTDRRTIPDLAYIQKPVRGCVCGVSFLGDERRAILLGVCRLLKKRIGRMPFVFAGAIGPIALKPTVLERLHRLGDAFAAATCATGPFNIDVVIQGDSVTLLEVNPRWSGSMEILERAWSERLNSMCSFFDEVTRWKRRCSLPQFACPGTSASSDTYLKRIVFARRDRIVSPASFDQQETDGRWVWKDIPRQSMPVKRHEPLATLITRLDRLSLHDAFRIRI